MQAAAGQWNALAVLAVADHGNLLHAPDMYMEKIAVGPESVGKVSLDARGTGIPTADIKKAIEYGHAKINVNTESQISSANAVREVLAEKPDLYDPRKYLGPARDAIKETVWTGLVNKVQNLSNKVRIALVGKYVALQDAYLSVAEALRHAGYS